MAAIRRLGSVALAALLFACSEESTTSSGNDAGSQTSTGGSGPGGATSTGGASAGGSGGATATGGATGAGGAMSTGGAAGSDGGNTGGAANTGGASGNPGTGGGAGDAGPGACGAIATFEDGLSPALEIHVAPGGDDNAGDGSAGNPYGSIDRAVNDATPGAYVHVHPGTYAGGAFIDGLAGTAAAPIWIGGAPGEALPVIDGGGESIHFVRARYIVLHHLEIRNQTGNGINADDGGDRANVDASRHLIFRDLSIHDIGTGGNEDCLKLSGLNDYFVLDSTFAHCGGGSSGSGIDHVGCHSGLIARNTFSALTGGGNAVQCKGGSEDIEIRWNFITDGGERDVNMGGSTGFDFFRPPLDAAGSNAEARNIRVVSNVIRGGTSALAYVGCVDCLAANNTIVDPARWILRILQETATGGGFTFLPAQNGRFVNNLVYFVRGDLSAYANVGGGTQGDTFTFANNLWYAHDDDAQSRPTDLPAAETGGVVGMDPNFRDAPGADYSIPPTSPAAGAGVNVPELVGDITGACPGSPPSIGAYEAR